MKAEICIGILRNYTGNLYSLAGDYPAKLGSLIVKPNKLMVLANSTIIDIAYNSILQLQCSDTQLKIVSVVQSENEGEFKEIIIECNVLKEE